MIKKENSAQIISQQSLQTANEVVESIIARLLQAPIKIGDKNVSELISNLYNENYNIHQGRCYQQFSPNLCGYHAIFNTFCFLKMFNGGQCQYNIESPASFWKFKIKVQNFLFWVKRKYNLPDQWPWRQKDIREGDYERTYNKVCMEKFNEFSIFNKHQKFVYLSHTWQFQYQNLVLDNTSKKQLDMKFKQFRQHKGLKPIVLHLMLGITTHWLTFLAVKKNNKVEYWFFDSHNHHYLDFEWSQIVALIEKKSKERTKYGKPEFTNFQKQSYSMCIKDIQTSLKLIIDCIEGKRTLDSYSYNHKFFLFADPLQAAMAADYESVAIVIRQYQYNIRSFFIEEGVHWQLLDNKNCVLIKQIMEFSKKIYKYGQQGKFLYSLTRMHYSYL